MTTKLKKYNKVYDQSLGIDAMTGLEIKKNIYNVLILGLEKEIHIQYQIVLVTPEGYIAEELFNKTMITTNEAPDFKYDTYDASPVGQGIKQILASFIDTYPNE